MTPLSDPFLAYAVIYLQITAIKERFFHKFSALGSHPATLYAIHS
jgi:hypothetical protein